jgi:hypothetical protein
MLHITSFSIIRAVSLWIWYSSCSARNFAFTAAAEIAVAAARFSLVIESTLLAVVIEPLSALATKLSVLLGSARQIPERQKLTDEEWQESHS